MSHKKAHYVVLHPGIAIFRRLAQARRFFPTSVIHRIGKFEETKMHLDPSGKKVVECYLAKIDDIPVGVRHKLARRYAKAARRR